MQYKQLALAAAMALTASARPSSHVHHPHPHVAEEKRDSETFIINVWNHCPESKHIALYQITSSFTVNQLSEPTEVDSGCDLNITAPFTEAGMRVSAHAEWGTAGQWLPQALAEFGYSTFSDTHGTAYDNSVMGGSDFGVGIYPANEECESKTCQLDNCPLDQGWTNEDQTSNGSPADTVCYHGVTDFKVVFW
ncbi:Osmotin/thaumatin-like superfamily [Teratosphaeria destructans]|uniref:Osmotin/thaumatin-like superfamily n=1 Tax=Teratosphaeria destructans TaxID=418781 RepID=A0A9W7W179_9PEZI|nr:Osmotin/thaumatin-like superfamily [Teratosphaeria destructans]